MSKNESCATCLDTYILSQLDFLHKPKTFPITKQTTKSYCGIFLSIIMIGTLIGLTIREFLLINKNYTISYSQDFISRLAWSEKIITIGFNVSKEWENKVDFTVFDSNYDNIPFEDCDENLNIVNDSQKVVYHCIVNYSLKINDLSSHSLKINLTLKEKYTTEERVPFSLAIHEPYIDHDNYDTPLYKINSNIMKFRCFFNTIEINSFRRYLKYVEYNIEGGLFKNPRKIEGIYLDDFEDTKGTRLSDEIGKLLGTYRILVSKKKDIYIRKHKDIFEFLSMIGGYISTLMTVFGILSLIFVNTNDNYRIFNYLTKKKYKNSDFDSKVIYDYYFDKKDKNEKAIDFEYFNKTIKEVDYKKTFLNKFCYFFFCCKKRNKPLSIINNYINENLTIDNYLNFQIKSKIKKLKKDLERKSKNSYNNDNNNHNQIELISIEKESPLINKSEYIETEEKESNYMETPGETIGITSFTEQQQEDIIKIFLSIFENH